VGANGRKAFHFLLFRHEGSRALFARDRVLCWLHAKTLKHTAKYKDVFTTKVFLAETGESSSPKYSEQAPKGLRITKRGQRPGSAVEGDEAPPRSSQRAPDPNLC